MKQILLIGILFCSTLFSCAQSNDEQYLFFLHNRFLEEHELDESHPEFGRTEYNEILAAFEKSGFKVITRSPGCTLVEH